VSESRHLTMLTRDGRLLMLVASFAPPATPELHHHFDVPKDERIRRHGKGTHTELDHLTVSEPTTVVFEWTIGEDVVETGGELLVCWRWPFDWSDLQAEDAAADGFMSLEFEPANDAGSDVTLKSLYNWFSGIEPWHHQIHVKVENSQLRKGDRIRLTCGDMSQGSVGWRAPTCVDWSAEFIMAIAHRGDSIRHRLVQQPSFSVISGPPVRLTAIVHSDTVVGEPAEVIVRAEDCWGNATVLDNLPVLSVDSAADEVEIIPVDAEPVRPSYHFDVTFSQPGSFRLTAKTDAFEAVTNPVTVHSEQPTLELFWGDIHSGQTEIGCGSGTVSESYAFGRDCAGLQFISHQSNDHYVTLSDWAHVRKVTDDFYEPGVYVPILGCEWSPFTKDGGDRNVLYGYDETILRRSDRFFREDVPDPEPDVPRAPEFHNAFRDLDVLVNIHVGGRMTNLDWYEQKIERLCETHSTHGTVEWFFMDALSRGYKVGLTAGTDGVMGRPGACHPGRRLIRNLRNGLTAVYAKELTRESIWEALHTRRTYATTGERIRLQFQVDGADMGSEIETTGSPKIRVRIEGTRAIERVDLFRGVEIIKSWTVSPPVAQDGDATLLRVLWGGTEQKGTARLQRVDWTGSLSVAGGTLELVEPINFQSNDDAATLVGDDRLEWNNKSAGNAAGILIRVHGDDSAKLSFKSAPTTFQVKLDEVRDKDHRFDAGGVGRFAQIGPPPNAAGPTTFTHESTDDESVTGQFPYWIRVTQIDQSLAWSSPVYVTRHS
jgi:ribosomal protein L35AE/L33A